jgi:hypothetical protein
MESLNISATQYTPAISLESDGVISFTGKSYPENTFEFYKPVMAWLEQYFQEFKGQKTTVNMEIIYFNSSSSKWFFDMFDLFDEATNRNIIGINWIFDTENESAQEAGEDFQEDFELLNINLVAKE